jgi:seryl-tRNA synthetase
MLSMDQIKSNRDDVERAIRDKGVAIDLDALLRLDAEIRGAKTEIEGLRGRRNAISARFKDASPEERAALGAEAKAAGAQASELEIGLADKEAELKAMMLRLPGIPWEGAPVGPSEDSNVVIRTEGKRPRFDFDPVDHVALIEKNDWAELSRIVKVSGSRTYCLKGRLALLETKLMAWALEQVMSDGSPRSPIMRPSRAPAIFPGMRPRPIISPRMRCTWRGLARLR